MIDHLDKQIIKSESIVSRETIDLLKQYQDLVIKWNKKTNLIAQSTVSDIWHRHIIDSLQLMTHINNNEIHLIDLGSGAGFPGIVLSLAGIKEVTLIESNEKKAAFLSYAASISKNKINIINKRAENINIDCDIISSRACASIKDILALTYHYKLRDKYLILKGMTHKSEISLAQKFWSFHYDIHPSITSKDGMVVELSNVSSIK